MSELGLTPENAPKMFELVHQEASTHAAKAVADYTKSIQPGGAEWTKNNEQWKKDALAHAEIGNGKQDQLDANVGLAKRVLARFGDQASIDFLEKSGLGSHPAALTLLVKIGKAMSESQLVVPTSSEPATKTDAQVAESMFPTMKK